MTSLRVVRCSLPLAIGLVLSACKPPLGEGCEGEACIERCERGEQVGESCCEAGRALAQQMRDADDEAARRATAALERACLAGPTLRDGYTSGPCGCVEFAKLVGRRFEVKLPDGVSGGAYRVPAPPSSDLDQACTQRDLVGCLGLVAVKPFGKWHVLPDDLLRRRTAALELLAKAQPKLPSEEQAVAWLGSDPERVLAAWNCAGNKSTGECPQRREAAQRAASLTKGCQAGSRPACLRLAAIVYRHDPARGAKLMADDCAARKLGTVTAEACLTYALLDRPSLSLAPPPPGATPTLDAVSFDKTYSLTVASVVAPPGVDTGAVTATVSAQMLALGACALTGHDHNPNLEGRAAIGLVVDGSGVVWRARGDRAALGGDGLPDSGVVDCFAETLLATKFPPTGRVETLRVKLDLKLRKR
jgi:hypothetical protein